MRDELEGLENSLTYRSTATGESIQGGAHILPQHGAKVLITRQQTGQQGGRCADQ